MIAGVRCEVLKMDGVGDVGQGVLTAFPLGEAALGHQALKIGDRMATCTQVARPDDAQSRSQFEDRSLVGTQFSDSVLMSGLCVNSERCSWSFAIWTHPGRVAGENLHQQR